MSSVCISMGPTQTVASKNAKTGTETHSLFLLQRTISIKKSSTRVHLPHPLETPIS